MEYNLSDKEKDRREKINEDIKQNTFSFNVLGGREYELARDNEILIVKSWIQQNGEKIEKELGRFDINDVIDKLKRYECLENEVRYLNRKIKRGIK